MTAAMKLPTVLAIVLCAALGALGGNAAAQAAATRHAPTFPTKPIRFVVPFPPSGANDILARLFAEKISKYWGQQLVVDNRPGAGSIIGSEIVAKAPPDGYTILIVGQGYALNPGLYEKLPYDTIRDFARVTMLATAPNVLVMHPSVQVKSVTELIALAKANPDGLNYASSSIGSSGHLSMELLKRMAGVAISHIPYKGAGLATAALVGGQVQLLFTAPGSVIQHVRAGRVRALGVTSAKRATCIPEVPAIAEAGLPGYEVLGFYGILAPARTPRRIIDTLRSEFVRVLRLPEITHRMESICFEPAGSTPREFTATVIADMAKYGKVLKEAGIKAQ